MTLRNGAFAIAIAFALAGSHLDGQGQGRGRGGGMRFAALDQNNDGTISHDEWETAFRGADRNADGILSRDEFANLGISAPQSAAYRSGFDRGLTEGRAAGREDHERKQGFDLEGQRELETADSGYQPSIGPKPEYQAGYRDGFRRGYREGWGPR